MPQVAQAAPERKAQGRDDYLDGAAQRRTSCRASAAHGTIRPRRNPERTYTLLNRESPEFVRFINPGD